MKNIRKTIKSVLGYSACLRHSECIQTYEFSLKNDQIHTLFYVFHVFFRTKVLKSALGNDDQYKTLKDRKNVLIDSQPRNS